MTCWMFCYCYVVPNASPAVFVQSRYPMALRLRISRNDQGSDLFINASTLRPSAEGMITTHMYTVPVPILAGSFNVCIGGLKAETFYNICVSTGSRTEVVCIQESTAAESSGSTVMGECLVPLNITSQFRIATGEGLEVGLVVWLWAYLDGGAARWRVLYWMVIGGGERGLILYSSLQAFLTGP